MSELHICKRCILPSTYPGIKIDESGLCSQCINAPSVSELQKDRENLKIQLNQFLKDIRGESDYDCIVAFSGGKDSTYTLAWLVKEYGLRCLAVTIENGFLSDGAKENCRVVTKNLGVDFSEFTPSPKFMKNMYVKSIERSDMHSKASITRASEVCNSCINLINNHMIKVAIQTGTPIVAGGYIGGQVPKDATMLEVDIEAQTKFRKIRLKRIEKILEQSAEQYFDISNSAIESAVSKKLTVINPMLTLNLPENEIVRFISQFGWKKTTDTGLHSTNCRLNDLGIYFHHKKYKFHPYVAELAEQVRTGLMEREEALDKVGSIPASADVSEQADILGIDLDGSE